MDLSAAREVSFDPFVLIIIIIIIIIKCIYIAQDREKLQMCWLTVIN